MPFKKRGTALSSPKHALKLALGVVEQPPIEILYRGAQR